MTADMGSAERASSAADTELIRWAQTRDPALAAEIAQRHDWLAMHCARKFRDRGEPLDDLTQVARVGLLKALNRFDPDAGAPFTAYATITMIGELRRHFRDTTWGVHVPRRIKDLQTTLRGAVESLTHDLGRPPLPAELATAMQVSEEQVLEALDGAAAYRADSLDAPAGVGGTSLGTRLEGQGPPGELAVEIRELLSRLPDRERRIIELRFLLGWSQSEIADDLGISQVHVSRLLRASLATLRSNLAE